MNSRFGRFAVFGPLVVGGFLAAGCGENGLGNIAEQCGFVCEGDAVANGNASISGVASVDSFFGAVVNFEGKANMVADGIAAALGRIAVSLELDPGATGAEISGALEAKFAADLQGGLNIDFAPPRCEVSAKASIEATAQCDASVDPGSVKAECSGTCEVEASAEVDCGAEATLECKGTAPGLACEGECSGSCEVELTAGGTCEGTCNAAGECQGECDGTCEGSCEVSGSAAANCTGKCKGECTYTPPEGGCEANATASCKAEGSAKVECSGRCEGEVTPPSASAECEASAKANAEMNAECTPPSLEISYTLSARLQGDANARAEFEAWLEGFRGNFQALVTAMEQANIVIRAGASLATAADGAVRGAINAQASGDVDLKAGFGLACAITNLPVAITVVNGARTRLQGQFEAAAQVTGSIG
jgi:hypothetical protein